MRNGPSQLTAPINSLDAVSFNASVTSERAAMMGLLVSSIHRFWGFLWGMASWPYRTEKVYEAMRHVLDGYAFLI